MTNLRLNKRLAINGGFGASIAANFNGSIILSVVGTAPTFQMTAQQAFRMFLVQAELSVGGAADLTFISVQNPQLWVVLDPDNADFIAYTVTKPPVMNPIGETGFAWGQNEVPLLYYSDYLQAIGHAYSKAGLDVSFDVQNSDAAAHTLDIAVQGVVEIFDIWDDHMLGPDKIGYGGPVRFPTS